MFDLLLFVKYVKPDASVETSLVVLFLYSFVVVSVGSEPVRKEGDEFEFVGGACPDCVH